MSKKPIESLFIVALSTWCILACEPVENSGDTYYNLDSLFQSQTQLLISSKAKVNKIAQLGGKKETSSFLPDSLGWIDEFGTLSELALINKPIYRGSYQVSDEKDNKSNLRILYYSLKKDKKSPIQFVRIYYLGSLSNIKRIEGLYNEENELYTGSRNLSVELQDVYNKKMITYYSIEGHQKMILADSVDFKIEGSIGIN